MKALIVLAFVFVACNKPQDTARVNKDSIDSAHVWPPPIQPLGSMRPGPPRPPEDTTKK